MPFAAIWMDQETVILNEVRQRQITYVEPKKKKKEVQRNVPTEQKELHMQKINLSLWQGRDELEAWC